jgi:tetratricopeptide (TPR) repeat protein
MARGATDEAILHYRIAIARDPALVEAYYNLATALEAKGDMAGAETALDHAILIDELYADALFNLGQLKLKRDDLDAARVLFELYLASDPPREWAKKAKRAIKLIDTTKRRAGGSPRRPSHPARR